MTDHLKSWLQAVFHENWLSTVLTIIIVFIVTAIVAHLVTIFLKKILKSKHGPLPALSIFINVGRIIVWCIGICVILSSCFNIDVGAAFTALGVGGIAISLGFQDTLSNLIGGLQIIMTGLIEPGDRIKVSGYEGTVHDVTWRHTTIITVRGERVVIPNSLINSEAMIKLPPDTDVRIEIVITPDNQSLQDLIPVMENDVKEAVSKIAVLEKQPKINVTGSLERGYKALLTFAIGNGVKKGVVIDGALKAISSSAVKAKSSSPRKETLSEKINNKHDERIERIKQREHKERGKRHEYQGLREKNEQGNARERGREHGHTSHKNNKESLLEKEIDKLEDFKRDANAPSASSTNNDTKETT